MRGKSWFCVSLLMLSLVGCGGSSPAVNTLIGKTVITGAPEAGATDGNISVARFRNPVNVAVDSNGRVYVCDFDNSRIRVIDGDKVSTLVEETDPRRAGKTFTRPFGITLAPDGFLYVQTDANDLGERNGTTGTVWKIDRSTGEATVVIRNAGRPRGLLALPDGRIVMSNLSRNVITILDPKTGSETFLAGQDGVAGFADGKGTAAKFSRPYGLTLHPDGSLLVADQTNCRIRRVTLSGEVSTFVGTGVAGKADGTIGTATLGGPQDVEITTDGNVLIIDTLNYTVREVRGDNVSTILGSGIRGYLDEPGLAAQFNGIEGAAMGPDGHSLFLADGTLGEDAPYNHIRRFYIP